MKDNSNEEKRYEGEKPLFGRGLWGKAKEALSKNASGVIVAMVADATIAELRVEMGGNEYSVMFETQEGLDGLGKSGKVIIENTSRRRHGYPRDYEYSSSVDIAKGYGKGVLDEMNQREADEIVTKIIKGGSDMVILSSSLDKEEGDITLEEAIKNGKVKGFESR